MSKTRLPEPPHLVTDLKALCLTSVAKEWPRLTEKARSERQVHQDFLADVAAFEVEQRRERRIQRRMQDARFPVLKTLDSFDFGEQCGLDRDEVLGLARADFARAAENVVLIGPVGTGKTHIAIALGLACVQQDLRVRFTTAAGLCNVLTEAQAASRLTRTIERLARFDVVILDELGYVPFDRNGSDLLFNFIARVYEQRSLIVTTNLPFSRWAEVFGDATAAAAVIDRIVHHATVLQSEGGSFRLKEAKQRTPKRGRRKEGAAS